MTIRLICRLQILLSLVLLATESSAEQRLYSTLRHGDHANSAVEAQRDLDQLPPSSELWCSFLNFCVDDSTVASLTPSTPSSIAPALAPEGGTAMDALCTFLQLCDLTTSPAVSPSPPPTPTPATGAVKPAPNTDISTNATTFEDYSLLDLCVYIGLCMIVEDEDSGTSATTSAPSPSPIVVSPEPTMVPTYPEPPEYDSVCEFLGNCKPSVAPAGESIATTLSPTPIPNPQATAQPTAESTSPALESNAAVDFLCSVLGWCDSAATPSPTAAAAATPAPTPAPTRATLLCLISRIC